MKIVDISFLKDSEIKPDKLCLNISKDFTVDNMKNTGFFRYVNDSFC